MISVSNIIVVSYTIVGHLVGILLVGNEELLKYYNVNIPLMYRIIISLVLLSHTITYSGYLHHDLAHNSVFSIRLLNHYFLIYMDWLNGACYWSADELRAQHLKHHMSKVDFDVMSPTLGYIQKHPMLKSTLLFAEYFYIPLNYHIVSWRSALSPWWEPTRVAAQPRTITIFVLRCIYFYALYLYGGFLLLFIHLMAYHYMIHCLRFTDFLSHNYEVVPFTKDATYNRTKEFDMRHSFSLRIVGLPNALSDFIHGVLFLRFNEHNQHHHSPSTPWFGLGSNFQEGKDTADSLCGVKAKEFVIPFGQVLYCYHKYRLERLFGQTRLDKPFDSDKGKLDPTWFGSSDVPFLALEI